MQNSVRRGDLSKQKKGKKVNKNVNERGKCSLERHYRFGLVTEGIKGGRERRGAAVQHKDGAVLQEFKCTWKCMMQKVSLKN